MAPKNTTLINIFLLDKIIIYRYCNSETTTCQKREVGIKLSLRNTNPYEFTNNFKISIFVKIRIS